MPTQWGVVHQNVATLVDAPRVKTKEIETLSAGEIQAVLETLRGRSLYPITAVALGTGMRRGELLALRWQDVDLDGATLRIERALEQTKRGGLVFKSPKTAHGRRTISSAALDRRRVAAALEGSARAAPRARHGKGRTGRSRLRHLERFDPVTERSYQGMDRRHATGRLEDNTAFAAS